MFAWFKKMFCRSHKALEVTIPPQSQCRMDIPGEGPIVFEGNPLPEGAKYFSSASFYESLPEDIKNWVLDLRYAWGKTRKTPSSLVLQSCDAIEKGINEDRATLFAHLRDNFNQKIDPEEICQEWRMALQIMRQCAHNRDFCTWTVPPVQGEVSDFLTQAIGLVRAMEKANNTTLAPPGYIDFLKTATEEKQIHFILQVTENFGSRRSRPL